MTPARTWPLFATATTMSVGFAAVATVAPVVQSAQGLGERTVALAGAASSLGTVVGAFMVGARRRISRRALQAPLLLLLATGGALTLVVQQGMPLVPWLRLADGLALGAALVACETLLLLAVEPARRARALALYSLATSAGWLAGPALASLVLDHRAVTSQAAVFGLAAGAALLALLVAMLAPEPDVTRGPSEETRTGGDSTTTSRPRSSAGALWRRNLVPCVTTGHFGGFQAALLVLLPLHLLRGGGPDEGVLHVLAAFALGMLLLTLPHAHLGARFALPRVIAALCAAGGAALIVFASLPLPATDGDVSWTRAARLGLAFVVGGTLATLSPLSLMLQVRLNDPAELARANALYNTHYAVGMLLGPLVVSAAVDAIGPRTLIVAAGAGWLLHAVLVGVSSALVPVVVPAAVPAAVSAVVPAAVSREGSSP